MDRRDSLRLTGTACLIALMNGGSGRAAIPSNDQGLVQTKAIADAARSFLGTLGAEQRAEAQMPFTTQAVAMAAHFKGGLRGDVDMVGEQYGRAVWSNFPVSDVPRPGLRLGSLDDAQRAAAVSLLQVMLSDQGYRKVLDIMGADQALADSGTPYASGRAAYTLAIFGAPGLSNLWMVQFGGHHLALNVTMLGGHGVLAPVLTGALPASCTENGIQRRALAAENDKAFGLLDTLDARQRQQAMVDHPVSELVLGPGHDGQVVEPSGVKASSLSSRQQAMLFDLISEWAGIVNDTYAAPRLAEIRAELGETYFAWSGPTTHQPDRNGASYFRIQGPNLFIEFSPQEPGGDLTMHVHTIYRDPANAYGKALV